VPPAIAAVAEKELRYLVRDPFFKATIAQTIYMLAVFAVMLFQMTHGGRSGRSVSGGFLWGGIGMLLMVQSSLALNSFGPEGSAASLLFLFPCSRREILIGKNVVLFLGLGALNSVIATGLCLVAKQAHLLPLILIWTMLACALFVGCGNIMSALFPFRIAMKGWVMRRSASMGCSASLAYAGAMLVIGLLMLPVAAALVVPTYWVSRLWLAVTIPVAVAYVAGIYIASLRMTEEILREREPEIAARLAEAD
jgi:ABC-type transport system involved in multi-copper enzyme maturation permease subunit